MLEAVSNTPAPSMSHEVGHARLSVYTLSHLTTGCVGKVATYRLSVAERADRAVWLADRRLHPKVAW